MDNQVIKDGLENGAIAALWALIPGILILTSTENDSDFDLLLDFLGLMILFPVILVIVSIISAQKHSLPSEIMLNCISCCVSGAIFFNLILQFFFYVNASIDDTQYEFELSELVSLNTIIKSLLLGLFSSIFVITNQLKSSEIKKDELIPREILKTGDRVKAYCYEVKKELKGHQIFLSRAHPQFLAKLFFQEVPEIYEGVIEIKSVARDPGSRAKICVQSKDNSIDPVGACVGMRGSRVQTVVNELHGEKIDIIKWTEDLPTLISESLSPAEIQKVLIDQENKRIDVILSEENLSKAIGRRGQNVRLASKLTNYEIDILTDSEDSDRRQAEFKDKTETLIKNLEVDETLGQLLVSEGLQSIEEISQSNPEDITKIEGIDEGTAKELIERSKENLIKQKEEVSKKLKELGVEQSLINLKGITQGMLVLLGQRNIKKLSDFADLSSDELIGGFDEVKGKKIRIEGYLEEFSLSREEADQLIMAAREIVFDK